MSQITETLEKIIEEIIVIKLLQEFGDVGTKIYQHMTKKMTAIFQKIDPYNYDKIIIIASISENISSEIVSTCSIEEIVNYFDDTMVIEITNSNTLHLLTKENLDLETLKASHLIYTCSENEESFIFGGNKHPLTGAVNHTYSTFSKPTYLELSDALTNYHFSRVKNTSCPILRKEVWHDDARIILRNKPEDTIQLSLLNFLQTSLRNAHVEREQPVDASRPVDLRVSWDHTNRDALIEIKWLGDSIKEDGVTVGTSYRDARANSGAKQTADYLDLYKSHSPIRSARGYLVVYDARRKGIVDANSVLSKMDAFHYKDKEITYNPDFCDLRDDFEKPVRMFAEPLV